MSLNKLKEMILYIADKCQYRPNFGATMLNKILFYSDFISYKLYGESVTGEEYVKLQFGPVPKRLLAARGKLIESGDVVLQKRITIKGEQDRIVPLGRQANLNLFEPWQIALVDAVLEDMRDHDAESVSGLSHKFYGWQITKTGEVIPYATVFLLEPTKKDPPPKVHTRIAELIRKHEL